MHLRPHNHLDDESVSEVGPRGQTHRTLCYTVSSSCLANGTGLHFGVLWAKKASEACLEYRRH